MGTFSPTTILIHKDSGPHITQLMVQPDMKHISISYKLCAVMTYYASETTAETLLVPIPGQIYVAFKYGKTLKGKLLPHNALILAHSSI